MPEFFNGDIVLCVESKEFTDGSSHYAGQTYLVTEKTASYYNVCNARYKLLKRHSGVHYRPIPKNAVNLGAFVCSQKSNGEMGISVTLGSFQVYLDRENNELILCCE